MKQKKKIERLKTKQKAFDKMITNPRIKNTAAFHRPGSMQKS